MMIPVHNHASVVLIYNKNKIISNVYDNTYPKEIWRGRINLVGGGQSKGEISPESLLKREITEEFNISNEDSLEYDKNFSDIVGEGPGAPRINLFASKEDILLVRNFLLKNYKPWKDFLVNFPEYNGKPSFNIILSSYLCNLSDEVMKCFEKNISEGKSLVSEGFLRITSLSDLSLGKILPAWAAGIIISDFFKKPIPNPENIQFEKLGIPRDSIKKYFKEYDYFIK